MAKKGKFVANRQTSEMDAMLPFMSMLLIIIPILIGNISFFQLKSIEFSIPGLSEPQEDTPPPPPPSDSERKVMSQLTISESAVTLELRDEETAEVINRDKLSATAENATKLWERIVEYKNKFIKLDMMLVNVQEDTPYDVVAQVIEKVKEPVPAEKLPSLPDLKSIDHWKINMVMLPAVKEDEELGTGAGVGGSDGE